MTTAARKQAEKNVFMEEFYSLHDIAKIYNIPEDVLRRWTDSNHAPHYDIEGLDGPHYKKGEIYQWITDNAIRHTIGLPLPKTLDLVQPYSPTLGPQPPTWIAATSNLCWVPMTAKVPGVYFLCRGNEIVYVGKSDSILDRICTHIRENTKEFDRDRIFFVPCPPEQLGDIEAQYIAAIKPRYNTVGV